MRKKEHEHDFPAIAVGSPKDWLELDNYGNVVLDVKKEPKMSNEKWLQARKTANGFTPDGMCIGGSAASVVAGIRTGHENGCLEDTFNSHLDLYNQMVGIEPVVTDDSNSEILEVGHVFEDAVATIAAEELQKTFFGPKNQTCYLVNDTRMFLCGIENPDGTLKYPHAIADIDRLLEVHDTKTGVILGYYGLEIKTTHIGGLKKPQWITSIDNPLGVPEKYEVQTRHYMGVLNLNGFFIACQEHSMLPRDLCIRFIPRDLALEKRILDNEEAFAQQCLQRIPPEPFDDAPSKYLDSLGYYTESRSNNEEAFEFPPESAEVIENYLMAEKKRKELDAEYKKKCKPFEDLMSESAIALSAFFEKENKSYGTMVLSDDTRVFVRQQAGRTLDDYDMERMKKENPDLAAKCIKEKVVKKGLKKADAVDLQNFSIPGTLTGKLVTTISTVKNKTKK